MKALASSLRRSSWIGRGALVAIPLGLIACGGGSSQSSQPAQTPSPAIGGGPAVPPGMEPAAPLIGSMTTDVPGLSSQQAATGTGALLGLAQARMPASQFAEISNSMPGTDALIDGAVKAGLPQGSGLTDRSSLNGVFNSAGISPDQVSPMVAALGKEISKYAGPSVAQSFLSAVK